MREGLAGPSDVRPGPVAEILGPLGLLTPAALVAGRVAGPLDALGLTDRLALPVALAAAVTLVVAAALVTAGRGPAGVAAVIVATMLVTCAGVLLRLDTAGMGFLPDLVDRGGTARIEASVAAEPRAIALGWQTVLTVRSVDGVPTRERAVAFLDGPGTYEVPPGLDIDTHRVLDISVEPRDGDESHSGRSILRGTLTDA